MTDLPGAGYGIVVGWAGGEPETIEQCKQQTHDAVIDIMGEQRTGGVEWRIIADVDDANHVLDQLVAGDGMEPLLDELFNYYRSLRGMLREHGGVLIMAMAPGVKA